MPRLPSFTVPLEKGAPPPQWCPRCLSAEPPAARKQNGWMPVPGNLPDAYLRKGWRALAMCSGCMFVLAQEVD